MILMLCAHALASGEGSLSAAVNDDSVTITVTLFKNGTPDPRSSFNLVRLDSEGAEAVEVLTEFTFATEDATGETGQCNYQGKPDTGTNCTAFPANCQDCDADGTPECTLEGWCTQGQTWDVTEPCVDAGDWSWELRVAGESTGIGTHATVDDVGQQCSAAPDDSGADKAGAEPGGCGCQTGGTPAGLLALLAAGGFAGKRRH